MSLWLRLRNAPAMRSALALPLLLLPYWLKWAAAPAPFSATYVMGFVISAAMVLALVVWGLLGMPGIARFIQRGPCAAWAIVWGLFCFWALITQTWAFVERSHPEIAQNYALHMGLVGSYALMLACAAPSPRIVLGLLAFDGVVASLIGGAQVACQCSLGLKALGEVALDVARSGTSVIQGEGLRWLRPYGFLPHPNIEAGMLLMGVFAATGLFFSASTLLKRWVTLGPMLLCLWMLLLGFSRGAWAGLGVGALVVLAGIIGRRDLRRRLVLMVVIAALLGCAFFALYRPLVIARTGAGQENTEMRSLADRVVYNQIAQSAIARAPLVGLGGGNTPWYASYYLVTYTDYDLQGDHVHNVYLEIWADLGLIGLVLFGLLHGVGLFAAIQSARRTQDIARWMMIGGWAALAVVAVVDHYPWSLVMGQTLWVAPLAVAMAEPTSQLL